MKRFYERFSDSDEKLRQAVAVLPWGHILRLMSKFERDDAAVMYYANETVRKGWNRDLLLNAIKLALPLKNTEKRKNHPKNVLFAEDVRWFLG